MSMPVTLVAERDEDRCPKALAAGQIEHPTSGDEFSGPQIPVQMLVDDLYVGRPRNAALPGPLDQPRGAGAATEAHRAGPVWASMVRVARAMALG